MSFTHIHLHTELSTLDGAIRIKELIQQLKDFNMESCAITDHGWCAGVLDFYEQMTKAGLKPLLGVEAYITQDPDGTVEKQKDNRHLILLAKDNEGLQILFKLVSEAALKNFYYKPRIHREKLRQCAGHVVASSACLASEISRALLYSPEEGTFVDPENVAEKTIRFYREIFHDDFYLELQDWPDSQQQLYNRFLMDAARRLGIPLILTADCHYLKKEDHQIHELMIAIQLKQTLEEYRAGNHMKYGPYFYLRSPEEMKRSSLELDVPEAYSNTQDIVKKCSASIEIGKYKMPTFDITKEPDYQKFLEWKKDNLS